MARTLSSSSILMLVISAIFGVAAGAPEICMSAPAISLQPGTVVSAKLHPQGKRCSAKLVFTNPDFLPVNFGFSSLTCLGFQLAEFSVPAQVPNGDAFIIWQCAGVFQPTCTKATISGGQQDPDAIVLDQYGTINCLIPTATLTTVTTSTGASTTAIETLSSVLFSTSAATANPTMWSLSSNPPPFANSSTSANSSIIATSATSPSWANSTIPTISSCPSVTTVTITIVVTTSLVSRVGSGVFTSS